MQARAASLRVGSCEEWKRGFRPPFHSSQESTHKHATSTCIITNLQAFSLDASTCCEFASWYVRGVEKRLKGGSTVRANESHKTFLFSFSRTLFFFAEFLSDNGDFTLDYYFTQRYTLTYHNGESTFSMLKAFNYYHFKGQLYLLFLHELLKFLKLLELLSVHKNNRLQY